MIDTYPAYAIPTGAIYCRAPGCAHKPATALAEDETRTPRWAVAGSDLCDYHVRRFAELLEHLVGDARTPGHISDLQRSIVRRAGSLPSESSGVRSSSSRDAGDLWNPYAAAVLYEIQDWTGFLVRTVLRERPLGPVRTGGLDVRASATANLEVIRRYHARWLALYPRLGHALYVDLAGGPAPEDDDRRVKGHIAAAIQALDAPTVRRFALRGHFCRAEVQQLQDGTVLECRGQLVGVARTEDDRRPSEILCETNPAHRVPRDEWMAHAS